MTTCSEDVLLQVNEVRYKKGDGTLYVMNERLAWMADNQDTLSVYHRFSDIKSQKISPDGKPKVQLQIVLNDGNTATYHFVNRKGQQAMIADRNEVKELMQNLLPKFKRKIDKDLEEKNRFLWENPYMLQLYTDLVSTNVISSTTFWETCAKDAKFQNQNKKQNLGVSAAFLANIKPQMDGCNGLKYNLTDEIIHCIFKTYPIVKRKHHENVPTKMTEAEFWTKFFQSHYFHRDRIVSGTKDIFADCGRIDDQTLKAEKELSAGDPLYDVKQFEDISLEDGFCTVDANNAIINSGNIVHQSMVKRFNQHSTMVLKTCMDTSTNTNQNNDAVGPLSKTIKDKFADNCIDKSNTLANNVNASNNDDGENVVSVKKQRIKEKIHYDDLDNDSSITPENQKSDLIDYKKVELYMHGPIVTNNTEEYGDRRRMDELHNQLLHLTEKLNERQGQKTLVSSTAAVNALGELSPGGALMRGYQEETGSQLIPPEFEKDLRNLYISMLELLKHFWECFPVLTKEQEKKVIMMHETLQTFSLTKIKPFEERAIQKLSPLGGTLTQHLNRQLQAANTKFASWRDSKLRRKKKLMHSTSRN